MTDLEKKPRRSVLDPIERSSEVLFGLIMVLSFTGSMSIAASDHAAIDPAEIAAEIKAMLVGALGCNLAWGIVDAIMYLLNTLGERGRELKLARGVRDAKSPEAARAVIEEALPGALARSMHAEDFERIAARVRAHEQLPESPRLHRSDLPAAVAIFLLVFVSTLPVVIPFAVMRQDAHRALRVSNTIAVAMLFLTGHSLGRYSFKRPWVVGVAMVAVGLLLVSITMALGG
jgi:VIT1/CCC1 family predicted Fe2+/Mn2+ transporter